MRRGFFLPKKDDPDGGKSLKDVKQENPKNEIPKIPNLNAGTMQKTTSEKLDSHILSRIFVQFLTLKEETKPHREISNRRPYRIFLLNKTCYNAAIDSLKQLPILKIYTENKEEISFCMDLDFSDTLHKKYGSLAIYIEFLKYFLRKHSLFIDQLSISLQDYHPDAKKVLEKIDFSSLKCTRCAMGKSEIRDNNSSDMFSDLFQELMRQKNNPTPGPDMAGHYEKILKSIAPSLKFLTIDIEFVKQCPKMDLTEVSIKNANPDYNIMQGGISKVKTSYDLDAASRIKSNILNFSNKNNEPYWTPLIEFFAAFFVEEIHASVEMLQTPNNHGPLGVTPGFPFQNHNDAIQPNPFRFSSSITPTNQSVKKFFLKLPGSQWRGPASEHPPGEHLNDILSDLIKIFPCLECINISMTSRFQNHQPNTYDEIGGVDEFLQIYKKCYDTLYFKYKNCKPSINVQILYINDFFHVNRNQIPSSDFEAEINKQLPGFKKEQTSEEDMKIIESFKAPSYMFKPTLNHERTPTVITYQKEANLNEGKISLKGKAFVVYT